LVIPHEALSGNGIGVQPSQPLLVAEIVSPSNPNNDLIVKREFYARFGVAEYWIADRRGRSLTILQLGAAGKYTERGVFYPGEAWRSQSPFPLQIGPAELF
jgi:Uma2 family endonuclease